jgi:soluble lytic murein transglycosylase
MYVRRTALLKVALALFVAMPGIIPATAGSLSDADIQAYRIAFEAAEDGKIDKARAAAATVANPALRPVIDWLDYRRAGTRASFVEIAAFVESHPDWPYLETLRANAERRLADSDADGAHAWLQRHPPVTGDGALTWFGAMAQVGDIESHVDDIARAWIGLDFSVEAEKQFFGTFRKFLSKDDHTARLDRLIWARDYWPARRMLDRVDSGHAALGRARLALMHREDGVDGAVARVPVDLRDAPELWYERLRWRRISGFDEKARTVLLDPPPTLIALPTLPGGDRWAQEAQILARRALSDGLVRDAYRLAAAHRLESGIEFAESEFLAGWIGHTRLRDHTEALAHFSRLYANVNYPISRARGAYWAAEAAAAQGDPAAAGWYRRAAAHPTTFYGQAALGALGDAPPLVDLSAEPAIDARIAFEAREIVSVVRLLGALDRPSIIRPFLLKMMHATEVADEMLLVAELALSAGQPLEGLRAAKRAYREDGALSAFAYPMIELPGIEDALAGIEPALVLALIRQESGFDRNAVSGAGARGLMQLLPSTALVVARKHGEKYSKAGLTADPEYNIRLGTAYLAELLERFDGATALALAGYNGGPRNVERWIAAFGDPRKGDLSLIDWIESIPFSETRNYVQRVLEAVPVYRQLLGDPQVATITIPVL